MAGARRLRPCPGVVPQQVCCCCCLLLVTTLTGDRPPTTAHTHLTCMCLLACRLDYGMGCDKHDMKHDAEACNPASGSPEPWCSEPFCYVDPASCRYATAATGPTLRAP